MDITYNCTIFISNLKLNKMRRPGCYISERTYPYGYNNKNKWVSFPTYQELKKQLKELIIQNNDDVHVFRERRGEWGEWFEIWGLKNDKPVIIKQGWC